MSDRQVSFYYRGTPILGPLLPRETEDLDRLLADPGSRWVDAETGRELSRHEVRLAHFAGLSAASHLVPVYTSHLASTYDDRWLAGEAPLDVRDDATPPVTKDVRTRCEERRADLHESMARALADWSHIAETWLVLAGEHRRSRAFDVLSGAVDARPGDKIETHSRATGARVWRVVDRLHDLGSKSLVLWVEPT